MPITSSNPVSIPAGNTQDALAVGLIVNPIISAAGIGGRALITYQHCKQLPSPDSSGNLNPVAVGAQGSVNIPNLFSTDPAQGDAVHQAALTALEEAVAAAIATAVADGLDPQCVAAYSIMTAVQSFVTAKGL